MLAGQLRNSGACVFNERFDILDESRLKSALLFNPEIVFHLASPTDVQACEKNPSLAFNTIVKGTQSLLKNLDGVRVVVFASSMMVYEEPKEGNIILGEAAKLKPATNYGRAKLEAERLFTEWADAVGVTGIILRIFPHTHRSQPSKRFLSRTLDKILEIPEGKELNFDESLNHQGRDIGAAHDLVRAFQFCLSLQAGRSSIFNVCSGQSRRLGKLAETMALQLHRKVVFEPSEDGFRENLYCGSHEKFSLATGWEPEVRTDDELIRYFLDCRWNLQGCRSSSHNQ
jgi:nucleoside-diphosphate-sugar epimerase